MKHMRNNYLPDATVPLALWAQIARISFESQLVIGMRLAGMMGMVPQSPNETVRMVTEKYDAAHEAFSAGLRSASRGESVERVMAATLSPYSKRTGANSRRLSKGRRARGA